MVNELVHILKIISRVFVGFAFIYSLYSVIISLFGIYKKKSLNNVEPKNRFALLVAAHNEEAVIGDIILSLNKLDYPKELYDIFVIADNCTDNTAKTARAKGAIVYERFTEGKRGKGFAMEWMFNKVFKMEKKYDTVAIFDADNIAAKDFLKQMNKKLSEGYKVVQGYLDSKNPTDTWITTCYSITFWQTNRMTQLARNNMGLSCQLGGTGLCIDVEILKKLGWGVSCLTEDLEFTCKLVSNGYKVGFAYDAVVYDEKPLTLGQSWRQRRRWMQGYADVSGRYFLKLLKKGIMERSLTAIDCAIYTIQPVMYIIMGIVTFAGLMQGGINIYSYLSGTTGIMGSGNINIFTILTTVFAIFLYVYTPFLLNLDKKLSFKIILYYVVLMPVYTITWFPIAVQGILKKNDKEWSHTKHTRSVDIDELEKAN